MLPGVLLFGSGLVALVAPVTATVLAAADDRHAGVASGINNAVARTAGLLAVAVLPVAAGLGPEAFDDPARLEDGFGRAMLITAVLALVGAALAWWGLAPSRDVPAVVDDCRHDHLHCPLDAPPAVGVVQPSGAAAGR